MTITIAQQDYLDLFDASTAKQSDQAEFFDIVAHYPELLGQGCYRTVDLREGIDLRIDHYRLHDDVVLQLPERSHPIEYSFYLTESYQSASHYCLYGSGTAPVEICRESAGSSVVEVNVHLEASVVQAFLGVSFDLKAAGLDHLVQSEQLYYQRVGKPTMAMQTTLHQLLNCPFSGITRKIYLETKVWELMALLIDQELKLQKGPRSITPLNADDIDRIHHAKNILVANFDNPPLLMDLARQVGLNDCTLKRGFREVFGTTAFGYLHNYRLEQVRLLLQVHHLNVSQVARTVGYSSSNLSKAFRKKYGVSPKQYQAQHRNSV